MIGKQVKAVVNKNKNGNQQPLKTDAPDFVQKNRSPDQTIGGKKFASMFYKMVWK